MPPAAGSDRELDAIFGPLPPSAPVLRAVDTEAVSRALLPGEPLEFVGQSPAPWGGTWQCFRWPGAAERSAVGFSVEVYADGEAASAALAEAVFAGPAMPPLPAPGVGDRAFVAPGALWVQVGNVVAHVVATWEPAQEEMKEMGRRIAGVLRTSAGSVEALNESAAGSVPRQADALGSSLGQDMVSARAAAHALGLTVHWDAERRAAQFHSGEHSLWVVPGEPVATVDGQAFPLEAAPYIQNDRLILPLSALTRAFGLTLTEGQIEQVMQGVAE